MASLTPPVPRVGGRPARAQTRIGGDREEDDFAQSCRPPSMVAQQQRGLHGGGRITTNVALAGRPFRISGVQWLWHSVVRGPWPDAPRGPHSMVFRVSSPQIVWALIGHHACAWQSLNTILCFCSDREGVMNGHRE